MSTAGKSAGRAVHDATHGFSRPRFSFGRLFWCKSACGTPTLTWCSFCWLNPYPSSHPRLVKVELSPEEEAHLGGLNDTEHLGRPTRNMQWHLQYSSKHLVSGLIFAFRADDSRSLFDILGLQSVVVVVLIIITTTAARKPVVIMIFLPITTGACWNYPPLNEVNRGWWKPWSKRFRNKVAMSSFGSTKVADKGSPPEKTRQESRHFYCFLGTVFGFVDIAKAALNPQRGTSSICLSGFVAWSWP